MTFSVDERQVPDRAQCMKTVRAGTSGVWPQVYRDLLLEFIECQPDHAIDDQGAAVGSRAVLGRSVE